MPEVPKNMQHNLAHLEQQVEGHGQGNYPLPTQHDNPGLAAQFTTNNQHQDSPYRQSVQGQGHHNEGYSHSQHTYTQSPSFDMIGQPTFSRFPVLRNHPPNVPPTPEQKEATLEAARLPVLTSTDPHNQLDWAQDALAYVEEAITNERRITNAPVSDIHLSLVQQKLRDGAIQLILFLADQELPRALVLKGIWLEFGKFGHGVDKRQAWKCYWAAVKNAEALSVHDPGKKWGGRALYRIGMQFEYSNDMSNAIKYYQMGIDAGDSAAYCRLGMMVLLGQHGQTRDFQRGLDLIYSSALNADENAPQGAYVLGMLLAQESPQVKIPDEYLAKDINEARINIERAAFLGFAKAQVKLGSAYEFRELGCDFDAALSLHYNNLAARQGEAEAEIAICKWFLAGHKGVFEKDEEMAFIYAQRAAQDGLGTALFAMGYFHEVGIFVPVNLHVANDWYKKAAAKGNTDAAGRINCLSRSKTLSRKDHERVALPKIKALRPHSPTEPAFPSPAIPAMVTMPDPTRLSLVSPTLSSSDQHGQRLSQSVAPYPADTDFGSPRPGLVSQSSNLSNPEARPNSAFGINPHLRPSSAATITGTQLDRQFRPGSQQPGRPSSTAGSMASGYGRGGRVMSGPPPQGHHGRGATPAQNQLASPQPPPKVDIGFLAPRDINPKERPPKSDGPSMKKPLANVNSKMPPKPRQERTPNRPQSAGMASPQRLPNTDTAPQKPLPQQNEPPVIAASEPLPVNAQKPAPSPATATAPATATRPPGKGAKTFEEMGVFPSKKEDMCVSISPLATHELFD